MHGYLPTRTPLTQKGQIVPPSKMASPDESRANTLAYTVVLTADEANGPDTLASGGTFLPEFSTGDGPWDITVTVNNTGTVPITLGATVTEAADPDAIFTKDTTGYGGELQPSTADTFTIAVADGGADTAASMTLTVVAKANITNADYFYFTDPAGVITGIWFDVSGSDSEPAALTTIVAGGESGSAALEVDISGDTTAAQVMASIETVLNGASVGITSDDSAADGTSAIAVDAEGHAANGWTVTEVVADAGFLAPAFSVLGSTGQFTFDIEGSTFTLNLHSAITS